MNDTKTTLLAALPLLFIITALIAALIILPQSNLDVRDRAAEPTPVPTPVLAPGLQLQPETACSTLYSPVCGIDNQTYNSECEASLEGIRVAYRTACTTPLRTTPSPSPTSTATSSANPNL